MNSLLEQRQQLMVRKRELDASLSKPVLSEAEQKEQLLQQVKDDNTHTATFMRNIGDAEKRIAQIQKVGRCQACNRACAHQKLHQKWEARGRLAVQIPRSSWLILSITAGPGRI